mmetsp:Transcript_1238/g.1429  ORF Transcript_1238/g.1429 Transcript_1238/m.1429 type:complete len:180 (+) Transcript_1238:1168-1707(+)|eukprot:CAMPEP_0170486704 /NCGR_PEP_ID=MMETSP0208-20121228/5649_1 /TAXON_ID=197538 /ORGANISM="Strombidium inclinatum, Strain S3" /LENGTH=179 /DNA_ID=CAMNT_0010760719 /DNA_START=1099 /DNA_END=1638 /DNA_ORIENTATION=+
MNYYHQPTDTSKTLSQGTSKMMRMSSKDVTKPNDTSLTNHPKNTSQYNSNYQSINQSMDAVHQQESLDLKRQTTGSITSPQAPLLQSITPNQNISMIQPPNQVRSRIKKIISPIQGGPPSGQPDAKTLMMSQRHTDLEDEEVFIEHPKSQIQSTSKQPRPKVKRGESHDQNFIALSQMK